MLTQRHPALRRLGRPLALLGVVISLGSVTPEWATAEWPGQFPYLQRDRGWYFYNEPRDRSVRPAPEPEEETPKPERPDLGEPIRPENEPKAMSVIPTEGPAREGYLQQLPDVELALMLPTVPAPAIRAWLPVLMDQALTTMDRVSVRKYLLVQQESMRRSEKFSRIWQEVIWTDPGFDQPDGMPLGGIAQTTYAEARVKQEKQSLRSLQESVSLLLVVQPDCRSCELAWKILKEWGDSYQFTVRPIATALMTFADGTAVLPYPQIVESLQIIEFPSLYLVQPSTRYMTRLGTGILTEQEIATRLLRLIPEANPEGALRHAMPLQAPPASVPARGNQ